MNASNPLDNLKDIHLAQPISWWPPAWGWWLSAILLLALSITLIVTIYRYIRRRKARRLGMALLKTLDNNSVNFAAELNQLMKRLALSYFPRESIASLHQQQWLTFLAEQLPVKKRQQFIDGYQPVITHLYAHSSELADRQLARNTAVLWIKLALPPRKTKRVKNV